MNDVTSIHPDRIRERFDAARKQMRDAFIALGEGRISYDEAQDRYFDGNEELNKTWATYLLYTETFGRAT